ncbi:helix-turn-helix domain-containing protein [Actinopolyspora biskrensis]|uniref:helix-turn-helix domain-containing protein n=1 Tax=Actinopolyspora biskrensis TaxID=1470178 RepID=UPI0015C97130
MGGTRVERAYRYRFYPTRQQRIELLRTFGRVRDVHHLAPEARTRAWFTERRRVNCAEPSELLTEWKRPEGLSCPGEVSSVPLQRTSRHSRSAFASSFAERARYPNSDSRKSARRSAECTRSAFTWRDGRSTSAKRGEPPPLRARTWTCSGCGTTHDRHANATRNIKAAGLAVSACGAGVRPQRESSRTGQSATKQEPSGASRKGIPALRGGERVERGP